MSSNTSFLMQQWESRIDDSWDNLTQHLLQLMEVIEKFLFEGRRIEVNQWVLFFLLCALIAVV